MTPLYGNSDSDDNDEDVEFIDVDLLYNKLNIQLQANDFIIYTKKKRIITSDQDDEPPRPKGNREKRKPVKQVGKKSTKALVPISSLIGQPPSNIQALFINTNIVIATLHLFQIFPMF